MLFCYEVLLRYNCVMKIWLLLFIPFNLLSLWHKKCAGPKKTECSISLMLLDLYYTFKPLSVIAHGNSQPFSTLNRPDCHSLCRWCHYKSDTHPFLWHCLVWRHSPIIICAGTQSFALATRSTQGNHSRRLTGALSKLGEYLCIMSDAFGPIKRQESGWWERQWQEWIKSLIPSLTWERRKLLSQYVSVCACYCVCARVCLLLNSISCVATYSGHNIYRRSIVQIRGSPPSSLWRSWVKPKKRPIFLHLLFSLPANIPETQRYNWADWDALNFFLVKKKKLNPGSQALIN